jgi:hypothetical protein
VVQDHTTASMNGFRLRHRLGRGLRLIWQAASLRSIGFGVCFAVSLFLLVGCHSRQAVTVPDVEFTKIPPAAQGGRERVDTISGRVTGAKPGQRVVIYAMSGPWWVQPWPDQPFLSIQPDSSWSTTSHLGFKYAAILVDPGYQPPATMDVAPVPGGAVAAVKIVDGVGKPQIAPTVPIKFSGYDWGIRTIAGDRGGLNSPYDGDNGWTDAKGALHLRIKRKGNKWACAEVVMDRSLGYGTYIFTVADTSHLEPAAVLSLNTFDDFGGEQNYREVDVELSKWGDADSKYNAQFGIQPFYVPGNVARFTTPAGTMTYSFHWEPGRAEFVAVRGNSLHAGAPVVSQHVFTSGVPSSGHEKMQFLFYVVASDKSPLQKDSEVVLDKFEYLP